MKLLFGSDLFVADWVAQRIPSAARRMHESELGQAFGPATAIGVVDSRGELVGGLVYHAYDKWCRSIELSCAATTGRWLTREIVCALLRYPFDQLSCVRVTCVTPRRATSVRRFLQHLGFKREGLVRRGFGNDDAIILGLLRNEWRRSRWVQPLAERKTPSEVVDLGQEEWTDAAAGA
jgi:RimJ/RimL family protein N-acetyltransferase